MAAVSLVCRLPAYFPGVGEYVQQPVRRVSFFVQPGKDGANELVMTQAPLLMETNATAEPYSLVLARDVSQFLLEFYDAQKDEWLDEWSYTNQLPKLVRITLGTGKLRGGSLQPQDVASRLVALPATAVGGLQRAAPVRQPGPTNIVQP
jgi:hypothetical protein